MIALKIAHTYERAIADELVFHKLHHSVDAGLHQAKFSIVMLLIIFQEDNFCEANFEMVQKINVWAFAKFKLKSTMIFAFFGVISLTNWTMGVR